MSATTRLASWIVLGLLAAAHAPAATFSYHGTLQDGGRPAEGRFDLELTLYAAASGGSALAGPLTLFDVPVHGGTFSTEAEFGPPAGVHGDTWLDVKVRVAGSGDAFAALSARSPVTASATASVCPGAWTLVGNTGNPAGSYLGTGDSNPLVFDIAGAEVGRFSTDGNFSLRTTPIDASTELNIGGGPNAGGYANMFMHQTGKAAGMQMSVGDASSDANNDASLYLDQFNGSARSRRFVIGSLGGIGIHASTTTDGHPLGWTGDALTIGSNNSFNSSIGLKFDTGSGGGIQVQAYSPDTFHVFRQSASGGYRMLLEAGDAGTAFNRASMDANKPFKVGTDSTDGNGAYLTPGGVWTDASSRTFKEAFVFIDPNAILDKVAALPISTWQYRNDAAEGRHLGPIAEDFMAAFGLGNDERYISTADEEGVALAAIQGLNARLLAQSETMRAEKDAQIAELYARLDALGARLAALEADKGQ